MLERIIPSTKKSLPVIGLGTSRVFDIKPTTELLAIRQNILDILLDNGGTLIDTSPMYGKSEEIIGRLIENYDRKEELFLATKVWTKGKLEGENQIKESFKKMNKYVNWIYKNSEHLSIIAHYQDAMQVRN